MKEPTLNNINYLSFDPFKIPASLQFAQVHQVRCCDNQKASMCGKPEDFSDHCPCCGQSISQKKIPLCIKRVDLAFLGQGIPLFFEMTKQLILIVLILFVIFGLYSLVTNINHQDCIRQNNLFYQLAINGLCTENCPQNSSDFEQVSLLLHSNDCSEICSDIENICVANSVIQMSYANKQFDETSKMVQSVLILCSVIIFKVLLITMRITQRHTVRVCDQEFISPSDFTAMLTNLPLNYSEAELKDALLDFCYKFDDKGSYEIPKIIIAYDIKNYINSSREKMDLEKRLEKIEIYFKQHRKYPRNVSNQQLRDIKQKISELELELGRIESQVENQIYENKTQVAFVTFQTKECIYQIQLELHSILDQTKLSHWEEFWIRFKFYSIHTKDERGFYFKDRIIRFYRAPEPNDVFWENCGFDYSYQLKKRIMSHQSTVILLGVSFSIILGLNIFQNNSFSSVNDDFLLVLVALLISLMISLINQIIYYFIKRLGQSEKHFTKTHQDLSIATKLTWVQFFNSGLLTLVINLVVFNLQQTKEFGQTFAFSRPGGVISDAFFLLLVNSFFVPLISYFDPLYFIKLIKQRRFEAINIYNQIEANRIFEGPSVLLYEQYAHICLCLWVALFFASLLPISLLFCALGLIFYYWVQKYLLLRRNSKPPFQSYHLNREMMNFIELSPIIFVIGQIWSDYAFNSDSVVMTIDFISLGISSLELITPATRISKFFDDKESVLTEKEKYNDVYLKLPTDYDRTNPITQQTAIQNFIKEKSMTDLNYKAVPVVDTKTALQKYAQMGGIQYFKSSLTFKIKISMLRKIKMIRKTRQAALFANLDEVSQEQNDPIYSCAPEYQIVNKNLSFRRNSINYSTDNNENNNNKFQETQNYNFSKHVQPNKFEN